MRTLALTLAVWLAAAAPTLAQEAEPEGEAQVEAEVQSEVDAPPPEYERLVTEALEESAAGRWAEARALFTQAHEAYPNARTLRGIGVVSFELRDYVAALRALRAALEDERRPLTDAQRAEAEQVIERARAFVAIYTVDALPEDARLIVDGHPATSSRTEPSCSASASTTSPSASPATTATRGSPCAAAKRGGSRWSWRRSR